MKRVCILTGLTVVLVLTSCSRNRFHIYTDEQYKQRVEARFIDRKALAAHRDSALFTVLNGKVSNAEAEGLKFLYAYMPLSDLADYDGDFFLKQVQWSLMARESFLWGQTIPEDIFRHFVLPYRVNNENLDTARIVFFKELKDRIKSMSMLDAALEVNHWCHEKVTYRGSDIRTSAPLASMRTAFGRCGEESTFTVTALRSVAIPARQVYTPRWAHSDDNHAWIEFWADGKWQYLGACEPECVPNLGWFTEPARRAMLIHTKAFGDYKGMERVETNETNFALLNTLSTYAPTKEINIRVTAADGTPAAGAVIEFQLYNYAEYYPISVKAADKQGMCNFLTGFGDLVIWARSGDRFAFSKITVADTDTLRLVLDQQPYSDRLIDIDMDPPIQREPLPVSNDCRDRNAALLQREDSIRGAYEKTFPTEIQARSLAASLGLDSGRTWTYISRSRGNYFEIEYFLKAVNPVNHDLAMELLSFIGEKDLRDTKAAILLDHLVVMAPVKTDGLLTLTSIPDAPTREETYNPRVANEMLVAYRHYLLSQFGETFREKVRNNPGLLIDWIRKEIKISADENYYKTPLTPVGVFNLKVADEDSRKIFAVAALRTLGIPARLKPGTLEVQYWFADVWNTVDFGDNTKGPEAEGTLILTADPANPVKPEYETHYTLARFDDGKYKTLAYGYDNLGNPLAGPLSLPAGYYLLVTGNRVSGGKVLSQLKFFDIRQGETKRISVTLRKSQQEPETLAVLNPVWPVKAMDSKSFDWKLVQETNRAIVAWMEPDKEPSKHVFQDLAQLKPEIDKLGCHFVFLVPQSKLPAGFNPDQWKNLPAGSRFAIIPDLKSLEELEKATGKKLTGDLPVVIRMHADGKVTYLSSGYKIGIGEEIIKEINRN
jgi:transglutaminase-like putative cysteine protease